MRPKEPLHWVTCMHVPSVPKVCHKLPCLLYKGSLSKSIHHEASQTLGHWWLDSDGGYFCGEPVHLFEPGGYVNSNNSARTHLCFTMFDFASIEVIKLPKAQGRVTFCHAQQGDSLTEMMSKTTIKIVLQFPTDIARYSTRPMLHTGVWQKRMENQRTRLWSSLLSKLITFSLVINTSGVS